MYRQRSEVRGGGANYSTELAGRDRFKFFRRPVEPTGGSMHAGGEAAATVPGGSGRPGQGSEWNTSQVRFAASTPAAMTLPTPGTTSSIPFNPRYRSSSSSNSGAPSRAGATHARRPSSVELPGQRRGKAGGGRTSRARMHHLPELPEDHDTAGLSSSVPAYARGGDESAGTRDAGVQTLYRENEAQTDPYSPDYYIPDGAPEPEILKLQSLTVRNGGLPAGKEEVELILRLRRRREVEATLPTGSDDASTQERFRRLRELEEEEWGEREEHMAQLQSRRMEKITASLKAREAAHGEANRERLETIRAQYLGALEGKLSSSRARVMADSRRARGKDAQSDAGGAGGQTFSGTSGGGATATATAEDTMTQSARGRAKPDLIESYVSYGVRAAPPALGAAALPNAPSTQSSARGGAPAMTYDVRPALLTVVDGAEEVDHTQGTRIERVAPSTFTVPENAAIEQLPSLYQRREAERTVQSLERAHERILCAKGEGSGGTNAISARERELQRILALRRRDAPARATGADDGDGEADDGAALQEGDGATESNAEGETVNAASGAAPLRSVLDLYRTVPKVQRPETPVLELDGDADESEEEACILLQRLLRGRAVQNDYFEGKERCRGLIKELQAASDAQSTELAGGTEREIAALARQQSAMVDDVVTAALGDVVSDTLGFLAQELDRQHDLRRLEAVRAAAQAERLAREAAEQQRRGEERRHRDREEVRYVALVRATGAVSTAFLEGVRADAVRETALAVAVDAERERQAAAQHSPPPLTSAHEEPAATQRLVCDMLDGFVVPAVVDSLRLRRQIGKRAAPEAARSVKELLSGAQHQPG